MQDIENIAGRCGRRAGDTLHTTYALARSLRVAAPGRKDDHGEGSKALEAQAGPQ